MRINRHRRSLHLRRSHRRLHRSHHRRHHHCIHFRLIIKIKILPPPPEQPLPPLEQPPPPPEQPPPPPPPEFQFPQMPEFTSLTATHPELT